MSPRPSRSVPSICSGDMYDGVPIATPCIVSCVSPDIDRATPKSASSARPSSVMKMFSGFTSRWMIPIACAAESADATSRSTRTTNSGASGRSSWITCLRVRPLTCVITSAMPAAPRSSTRCTPTTFGCASEATKRASRAKRAIASSSSRYLARISLMATSAPVARSRARYTIAVPPRPISPRIQYSGSSAARPAGTGSLLMAGRRTCEIAAASASGRRSVRVETQHDLAKLDAVAIGELALAVLVRELLVVHYDGIRLRKVGDGPPSPREGKAGVLAADRAGIERDVLRRAARVAAEDELRLLPLDPDEPDLLVAGVATEDLEVTGEQLHQVVVGTLEAHRLTRR